MECWSAGINENSRNQFVTDYGSKVRVRKRGSEFTVGRVP